MYQPGYGLINYFLGLFGIPPVNWLASPDWAMPAVIFADVWQWTPFVALILLAGMQSISPEITEAAELDEPGALKALIELKLSANTPFQDRPGACKLIETAAGRGDPSMAPRLSECRAN